MIISIFSFFPSFIDISLSVVTLKVGFCNNHNTDVTVTQSKIICFQVFETLEIPHESGIARVELLAAYLVVCPFGQFV